MATVAALAWAFVRRRRMPAAAGEPGGRGRGVSDNETPIEKAVELLVYAPIGLAMFAKDTVPTFMKMFVARGHTEITQRRKTAGTQAGNYKTIGQMAVKYGGPEVKRQAGAAAETVRRRPRRRSPASPRPPRRPPSPGAGATRPARDRRAPRRARAGRGHDRRPDADEPRANGAAAGRHGRAADPRLRPAERHPGHRAARGPRPARAARGEGLRARPPGPHHDPRQDRAARAVTR